MTKSRYFKENSSSKCLGFASDEGLHANVDPLAYQLKMSQLRWLRTFALSLLVFPIRIILSLIILLVTYIVVVFGLLNLKTKDVNESKAIDSSWRRRANKIQALLGRTLTRVSGLIVTVKGEMASVEEAPILVVGPHSTGFDTIAVWWSDNPSYIVAEEFTKIPMLGKMFGLPLPVCVKRNDPDSRHNTRVEVMRRTNLHKHPNPDERWPQILIFPEGACGNRTVLMPFKLGAFYPGKPVQPILLRYPNKVDTITWTQNTTMLSIWTTLSQPFTRVEIEYLPVYHPNHEEQKDAQLFASNVRNLMSKELEIPLSSITFQEARSRSNITKNKEDIANVREKYQ